MTSGSDTIWRRWDASSTAETSATRGGQTAMHRFWTNSSCADARPITWRAHQLENRTRQRGFPQSDHYATPDFRNPRDKDRQP